jgi:hypothetical protein
MSRTPSRRCASDLEKDVNTSERQHKSRPGLSNRDDVTDGEDEIEQHAPPLSRILSRKSVASSWIDPGPAPDGGTTAWIQVLCTHLTIFTTFGFFTSFGVYQTYYEKTLGIAPSTISWIGSIQVFLLFGIGTITGRATDAGLFRPVYIAGAVFQMIGIFTMAESTKLWHLLLSQAVCLGIANGLQFCPAMALVSTYFVKKRAFALGITALGSCTGGVVFPVIVQQCLPRIGFPWTIRIIGFIMLASNAVTITLFRTRLPPRKTGPLVDWDSFKETPYSLYCAAMFFSFWGLYFAFFYIGAYARQLPAINQLAACSSIHGICVPVAADILRGQSRESQCIDPFRFHLRYHDVRLDWDRLHRLSIRVCRYLWIRERRYSGAVACRYWLNESYA